MHFLGCVGIEDAALIGASEFLAADCNRFFIAYSMCFISLWAKAHFAGSFFCSTDYFVASESTPPMRCTARSTVPSTEVSAANARHMHASPPWP